MATGDREMYAACSRSSANRRYLPHPAPVAQRSTFAALPLPSVSRLVTPKDSRAPSRPPHAPDAPEDTALFRRTLVKVMSMQVVALLLLWWLQARYNR